MNPEQLANETFVWSAGSWRCNACQATVQKDVTSIKRHVSSMKHPVNVTRYKTKGSLFSGQPIASQLNLDILCVMMAHNIPLHRLPAIHMLLRKYMRHTSAHPDMLRCDLTKTADDAHKIIMEGVRATLRDQWCIIEWDESGDTECGISLLGCIMHTAESSGLIDLKAVQGFGPNGGLENKEVQDFLSQIFKNEHFGFNFDRVILPLSDACKVNQSAWEGLKGSFPNASSNIFCASHASNNHLLKVLKSPALAIARDFVLLTSAFFKHSDARVRQWALAQGKKFLQYPKATSHYWGIDVDRAIYWLSAARFVKFLRCFEPVFRAARLEEEAKRAKKKIAKKEATHKAQREAAEASKKAGKKVEPGKVPTASEHATEYRTTQTEQLAVLLTNKKDEIHNELKIMAKLEGALKVIQSFGNVAEAHLTYGKFLKFADKIDEASPLLAPLATEWRTLCDTSKTPQFWKELALLDPKTKEQRRAAGPIAFPKFLCVPECLLEHYKAYIAKVEGDMQYSSPIAYINETSMNGDYKSWMKCYLQARAATTCIERVFSKLEWVDEVRANGMKADTLMRKLMMAYNKQATLDNVHESERRVDSAGRSKRPADREVLELSDEINL